MKTTATSPVNPAQHRSVLVGVALASAAAVLPISGVEILRGLYDGFHFASTDVALLQESAGHSLINWSLLAVVFAVTAIVALVPLVRMRQLPDTRRLGVRMGAAILLTVFAFGSLATGEIQRQTELQHCTSLSSQEPWLCDGIGIYN